MIKNDVMHFNKKTLAKVLKRSEKTLSAYQNAGMPIAVKGSRGTDNKYDLADVVEWIIAKESIGNIDEDGITDENKTIAKEIALQKLRGYEIDNNTKELKYRRMRQELVSVDKVLQVWNDAASNIRSNILNLAKRITTLVIGIDDRYEMERIIDEQVKKTLRSLDKEHTYEEQLPEMLEDGTDEDEQE